MSRLFSSFFLCIAIVGLLALTGCEAVNSAGQSITEMTKDWTLLKPKDGVEKSDVTAAGTLVAVVDPACPDVKVLAELKSVSQFRAGGAGEDTQKIAAASLDNIAATCTVAPRSVTLEISLNFTGNLGAAGVSDLNGQANYTYPYFLTVISPKGEILSKDVFALAMAYDKNNMSIRKQERLRQTIPLLDGQTANMFQIVAGFQLSAEELEYNRKDAAAK